MAIDARMSEREYTKFTESSTTPGEVVIKVANVDGSDIGGGGEASSVTLLAGTATAGKFYITDGTEDVNVNASNELEVAETNSTAILADTTSIDGKITACNTGAVVISSELPAGTQNIGDVDVASLPATPLVLR